MRTQGELRLFWLINNWLIDWWIDWLFFNRAITSLRKIGKQICNSPRARLFIVTDIKFLRTYKYICMLFVHSPKLTKISIKSNCLLSFFYPCTSKSGIEFLLIDWLNKLFTICFPICLCQTISNWNVNVSLKLIIS